MKILVSGRNGQLVRSLIERAAFHHDLDVVCIGRPELDLLDKDSLRRCLDQARPNFVVSAAAYTAVDQAESEPHLAFAINADGAGHLAAAAEEVGAGIIHMSTDYVFAGDKGAPYDERDAAAPLSAYGLSKYAGELAVSAANARSVILRIAWAHSPYGRNFIRSMLDLASSRPRLRIVADRFGSPTSMLDVADAILHIAGRLGAQSYGTYHLVNRGKTSWAGFAHHVLAASRAVGGPWAEVEEIGAEDFPQPAPRPVDTCLSSAFFERCFNFSMPSWQDSATTVAQRLARDMILPMVRSR